MSAFLQLLKWQKQLVLLWMRVGVGANVLRERLAAVVAAARDKVLGGVGALQFWTQKGV
jgi:hypothetical protein